MNTLAVLLTVHNRKNKTIQCLQSLFSQEESIKGWEMDVYLTDDGSTDGTSQAITDRFPKVIIIEGDGSLYWNRGMIKSWLKARDRKNYTVYLWLNDDTTLKKDALRKIISTYMNNPKCIIVGATQASNSEEITYGGAKSYYDQRRIVPNGEVQKCGIFNGNIVLVPAYVHEKLGTLDPKYSHALGDTDYGLMAEANNIECLVSEEILGICDRNPFPPKWQNGEIKFKERWQNFISPLGYMPPKEYFYFKRKHWGLFNAIGSIVLLFCRVIFPRINKY